MMVLQHVLVPFDFDAPSEAACDYLLLLVAKTTSVTLLHVCEPPTSMAGVVPGPHPDMDMRDARTQAESRLQSVVARLKRQGLSLVRGIVEVGHSVDAIVKEIHTGTYDLILMGTKRRTGLKRILLGSVTEGVLRRATPCPVLTLHVTTP